MRKIFYISLLSIAYVLSSCMKEPKVTIKPEPTDLNYPAKTNDFTDAERDLIMAGDANTPMRILKTTSYSDSIILRMKSTNTFPDSTDPTLNRLIKRMYKSMKTAGGVGIAAPQVGVLRNVIWVKRMDKAGQPDEVYINPRILIYSEKKVNFNGDGCLSVPNLSGKTLRSSSIAIEYYTPSGTYKQEVIEGTSNNNFTAVIFQHEIDHLNGILFVDRLVSKTLKAINNEYKKRKMINE